MIKDTDPDCRKEAFPVSGLQVKKTLSDLS